MKRDTQPLTPEQVKHRILKTPEWFADDAGTTIARTYVCKNFSEAIELVMKIAEVAEEEKN